MEGIIDISIPLQPRMPFWPGSVGLRVTRTLDMDGGDAVNNSRLDCDVHVGTHLDAPSHVFRDGCTVDELPLDAMNGPAVVVHLPDVDSITSADLERLSLPVDTKRLLFRTRNSNLWKALDAEFREDFVALTADAAQWIVDHGILLVGVDYLSVQRYRDSVLTHEILLRKTVIVLEGVNLADVTPGTYELLCLPLRLVGAEGAPARAVLRPLRGEGSRPL